MDFRIQHDAHAAYRLQHVLEGGVALAHVVEIDHAGREHDERQHRAGHQERQAQAKRQAFHGAFVVVESFPKLHFAALDRRGSADGGNSGE